MTTPSRPLPPVATKDEWDHALADLRVREKALTRQLDELHASRRRLPMVRVDLAYTLEGETGEVSLAQLFADRRQLIVYHFMFDSDWEAGCEGCSWVVDAMSHPAHLNARDTSLALVSRAPLPMLQTYRARMGWDLPWFSSAGTSFNDDFDATVEGEEHHGVSVFVRDDSEIYRTYHTGARGVEHLGSHWSYLDLTVRAPRTLGRFATRMAAVRAVHVAPTSRRLLTEGLSASRRVRGDGRRTNRARPARHRQRHTSAPKETMKEGLPTPRSCLGEVCPYFGA